MANFFIAVGGTGQMAALAYLRLARLCGFDPADIYLMDCDDTGPVSRELIDILGKQTIPTIRPIPDGAIFNKFKDIFAHPTFDDDINPVLSVLFTNKELMTPVKTGMYGRPSVGASALKAKIHDINKNNPQAPGDPNLNNLITRIQTGVHSVAICGSVLGGTGAGGVPTLAEYIRQKTVGANVNIIIIDFLKWFQIKPPLDQQNNGVTMIEDRSLQINAESGVYFLKDEIAKNINACVLLGLDETVERKYEEVGQQTDERHFINLLSAVIVNNAYLNFAAIFPVPNQIYCYAIPNNGLTPSGFKVALQNGRDVSFDKIIMMAQAIVSFLDFFEKYIDDGPPGFSFTPSLVLPGNLKNAIEHLSMANNTNEGQTYKDLGNAVKLRRERFEEWIAWFNDLSSPNLFEFDNSQILITDKNYKKTLNCPMVFLRKWIKRIDIDNWRGSINGNSSKEENIEVFVNQMMIDLRGTINKTYLNDVFGDIR